MRFSLSILLIFVFSAIFTAFIFLFLFIVYFFFGFVYMFQYAHLLCVVFFAIFSFVLLFLVCFKGGFEYFANKVLVIFGGWRLSVFGVDGFRVTVFLLGSRVVSWMVFMKRRLRDCVLFVDFGLEFAGWKGGCGEVVLLRLL